MTPRGQGVAGQHDRTPHHQPRHDRGGDRAQLRRDADIEVAAHDRGAEQAEHDVQAHHGGGHPAIECPAANHSTGTNTTSLTRDSHTQDVGLAGGLVELAGVEGQRVDRGIQAKSWSTRTLGPNASPSTGGHEVGGSGTQAHRPGHGDAGDRPGRRQELTAQSVGVVGARRERREEDLARPRCRR